MGSCRIIAGKWRGRRLQFPDRHNSSLRPTTDRTRETLFNWLTPVISDAYCFDPFAGSGILSFEALSRNAKHAVILEKDNTLFKHLKTTAKQLQCESDVTIIHRNYWQYIKQIPDIACDDSGITNVKFNVVFLDPPFHQQLAQKACFALANANCLADSAYIYLETEKGALDNQPLPEHWDIIREQTKGHVTYRLINATTV